MKYLIVIILIVYSFQFSYSQKELIDGNHVANIVAHIEDVEEPMISQAVVSIENMKVIDVILNGRSIFPPRYMANDKLLPLYDGDTHIGFRTEIYGTRSLSHEELDRINTSDIIGRVVVLKADYIVMSYLITIYKD